MESPVSKCRCRALSNKKGTGMHTYSSKQMLAGYRGYFYNCPESYAKDKWARQVQHIYGNSMAHIVEKHPQKVPRKETPKKSKTQSGTAHSTHLSTQSAMIAQCIVVVVVVVDIRVLKLKSVGCCHIQSQYTLIVNKMETPL